MACADDVPIEVPVGPLGFVVDVSPIAVPATFQQNGRIARAACSASVRCPTAAPLTLRCVAGACDPDPIPIDLGVMAAIDLGAYSSVLAAVSSNVSQVTVSRAAWQAAAMGLRVPVGPIELFWGPESATGIAADGVRRLGTVPVLAFDAQGAAAGDVALDAAGNAALSDHFLRVSRRFRLFARALVDLTPGGEVPAGRASIQLRLTVRAETRLLR
jgi:hypothetical protein